MLEEMVYTGLWKGLSKQERLEYAGRKVYREVGEKACLYRKVLTWVCSKKWSTQVCEKAPLNRKVLSMLEERSTERLVKRPVYTGKSWFEYARRKVYREVGEKSHLNRKVLTWVCWKKWSTQVSEKACLHRKVLTWVCLKKWSAEVCEKARLNRKVLMSMLEERSTERFAKSPF